jgi:hypothetical protein
MTKTAPGRSLHMVPKGALTTLPQYDEAVLKENKLPTLSSRPTDSVVRTISDLLEGQAR